MASATAAIDCPECGHSVTKTSTAAEDVPLDIATAEAQKRIQDLEAQVRFLNSKAAVAVDKLADYEDEVRALRAKCVQLQGQPQIDTPVATPSAEVEKPLPLPSSLNRQSMARLPSLSSLLPGRRKGHSAQTSDPKDIPPVPVTPSFMYGASVNQSAPNLTAQETAYMQPPLTLMSLQNSLEEERAARKKAELSLNETQSELEELTAQLFGQANEMVAEERKARAKLEERVKLLETRDSDKRKRLERLEKAVERIERVRKMVVNVPVVQTQASDEKILSTVKIKQLDQVDEDEVYNEFEKTKYHEWDVQLKVWRRSRANSYESAGLH